MGNEDVHDSAVLDGITYAFRLAGVIDPRDYAEYILVEMTDEGDWVNDVRVVTKDGESIELGESIHVAPYKPVEDEGPHELVDGDIVFIDKGTVAAAIPFLKMSRPSYGEVRGQRYMLKDREVVDVALCAVDYYDPDMVYAFVVSDVEFIGGEDD